MNRDEVTFYFRSIRLLYVVMIAVQAGFLAMAIYLRYKDLRSISFLQDESWLILAPVGLLMGVGAGFLIRFQLKKVIAIWGVAKKMLAFKNLLFTAWVLMVVGSLAGTFSYLSTGAWWTLAVPGLIMIYFITTILDPLKLARQLKLSRGELQELQSFYKKLN